MGDEDRIANKAEDLRGRAKEAAGEHLGDSDLAKEGRADQARAAVKDVGEAVKGAATEVGDRIKDAAGKVEEVLRDRLDDRRKR